MPRPKSLGCEGQSNYANTIKGLEYRFPALQHRIRASPACPQRSEPSGTGFQSTLSEAKGPCSSASHSEPAVEIENLACHMHAPNGVSRPLKVLPTQILLDFYYPFGTILVRENSIWTAGALLPLLFFWGTDFRRLPCLINQERAL